MMGLSARNGRLTHVGTPPVRVVNGASRVHRGSMEVTDPATGLRVGHFDVVQCRPEDLAAAQDEPSSVGLTWLPAGDRMVGVRFVGVHFASDDDATAGLRRLCEALGGARVEV